MSPSDRAGLGLAVALVLAPAAHAQYPLAPSPVLGVEQTPRTAQLGGYLAARDTYRNDSSTFAIIRGRLTATAAPFPFAAIRLQGDLSAGVSGRERSDSSVAGFELTDAYVELQPPGRDGWRGAVQPSLIVGQFKQPVSLEYLTPFGLLLTANRSLAVDQLSVKRDIGAMGQLRFRRWATLDASIVNGQGANTTTNPDGRQMLIGRLTLFPLRDLAIAGVLANQGPDHIAGADGRWLWRSLIVEGQVLHRERPLGAGEQRATAAYGAVALRLLPWLQSVYKYDWLRDARDASAGTTTATQRWSTLGVNVQTPDEQLRLLIDWVIKAERPNPVRNDELIAQLVASF